MKFSEPNRLGIITCIPKIALKILNKLMNKNQTEDL